jgi:predicted ATP-grasp superfamily ATP-dependent carboligase
MFTGGLENYLGLVESMAKRRPLWGNDREKLFQVRHPANLEKLLRRGGVPTLPVCWYGDPPSVPGRYVVKPLTGSGGLGIRFWKGEVSRDPSVLPAAYLQRYLDGESWAAVYVGNSRTGRLLGVTRQLVGCDWLHAPPFRYCGSIGPLTPPANLYDQLQRIGRVLGGTAKLDGLFGVDGIVEGGIFWPVEVNPRYTASVEVLEHATGLQALAWHRYVYVYSAPKPPTAQPATAIVGKAILHARAALTFPKDGPWARYRTDPPIHDLPEFADVPLAHERIPAGRPILTFFARAASVEECEEELRRIASDLDRRLFGR